MATPDGLIEARRAVLRAARDVETWDALWLRTRAWSPAAPAIAKARRDASNVLDALIGLLMDAQADADNDEADQRMEGTDDP